MRILTWNVNGIRTLPQYHPWNSLKTSDAILDELKADIICFQEMKTQRNLLPKCFPLPKKYDSFLSFPLNKGGYSGVAVYTKTRSTAPLKAEEGLTGKLQPKPPFDTTERISSSYPLLADLPIYPEDDGSKLSSLMDLDSEGRTLMLDLGLFVLINVYCPAETSETRLPYKMNFHVLLQERVRKLIEEEKRQVIVVGDINAAAAPIDHCDGNLPSNFTTFWERPPRAWFKNWLFPLGPMVDVVRKSWPDRKGMYTCWNTRISARDSNYGSRVDYILLTEGLLPWVRCGDIQPSIKGSDHCPVFIDLYDEIRLESGETLTLKDAMQYDVANRRAPRIAARFWDEYKQKNLSSFFVSKKKNEYSSSSGSSPSTTPPEDVQKKTLTTKVETTMEIETADPVQLSSQEHLSLPSSSSTSTLASSQTTTTVKPHHKRSRDDQKDESKRKKQKISQAKISSFFIKDGGKSSSLSSVPSFKVENEVINIDEAEPSERQIEEDRLLALQLSQWEENLDVAVESTSTSSSAPLNSQSKAAWSEMLAPIQPPRCDVHSELCKEWTVNKPGPNKGKTFFLCSRPVGPGYDKGRTERLREEVDTRYRCNYFKWSSEIKRESQKTNVKQKR